MWILIDNYDSFSHILHHYLLQTGNECVIYRNDELTITELNALNPTRIIISPGPETPLQAGISMDVIKEFHNSIPILGVCLGHQAIGMHFGAELTKAQYPMHGKTSGVNHYGHSLFKGIDDTFTVMRYHSLILQELEGTELEAIAHAKDDGSIMAIAHKHYPCVGIQFHPESIGTDTGAQILQNWASLY